MTSINKFHPPHVTHINLVKPTISNRDGNFVLRGFSPPRKGGGMRMWQNFSLALQGGAGMSLDFLDPPHIDKRYRLFGLFWYMLWYCLVKHFDNIIQFLLKISLIWYDKFSCNFKNIFINEIGFIRKIYNSCGANWYVDF